MSGSAIALPDGFAVGHWTDADARTGCTVVLAPEGTRGSVDVRGGGPGTRETDVVGPLANADTVHAVMLAGGSAFGLAAADGAMRWLEEHGRGYPTPAGRVPIVPSAILYDLAEGRADVRPGPDAGYAACEAARAGMPARGDVGAGTGAAVGKILLRERSTNAGIGYAASSVRGRTVAVIAAVNAFGDVLGEDGAVIAGPVAPGGELLRTTELLAETDLGRVWRDWEERARESTTLVCVCTDACLSKTDCAIVARMASAGIARAVDPVFSPFDGDVTFCLASGAAEPKPEDRLAIGVAAATLTAAAIRDGVRSAA